VDRLGQDLLAASSFTEQKNRRICFCNLADFYNLYKIWRPAYETLRRPDLRDLLQVSILSLARAFPMFFVSKPLLIQADPGDSLAGLAKTRRRLPSNFKTTTKR
jgi:hypothetical protein